MSFMENFEKELNGMRASEGKSAVKVSNGSKSSSKSTTKKKKKKGFMDNFYDELSSVADDDIGPVYDRARNRMTVKSDDEEDDSKLDFFQKGLFEDGYQAGDITKTILGTAGDAALGVVKGVGSLVEGVADLGQYGVAGVADLLGKEDVAEEWKKSAKWNLIDSVTKDATDYLDQYSVLGRTSEAILQGVGQVGGIVATGGLGAAAGLGTAGTTALTTGVMGLSSMGSGMGEAYQGGATDEEAVTYGLISGAADALTEMMFGGMGKAVNAVGLSKGLSSADDMLAKAVSKKFSNQIAKNFAEFGVKASAEGLEEVVAGVAQAMGKKFTYMSEKDMKDILEDENLLEQFIVGSATSGMIQSGIIPGTKKGSLIEANKNESDFLTGTTKNEQAVIRKEVENRVAAEEQSGKKLTEKEKDAIEEQVVRDLEKGYISTDTIEEVLGGSTYDIYKGTVDSEDAILREYEELGQKTNATLKDQARYTELTQKVKDIREKSQRDALKSQLGQEVAELVKGDRLAESYNERARRGQAFQADLTKYDAKQQAVIQKAIDSGILNNTNRTHEFVDLVSKISADKGVLFDFTNNAKLKDSGFAVDGKQVNGYVTKDGITLNIDSKKALETTVGHEITHVLEGTEVYDALKQTIFEYAKAKGEYQTRFDSLTELYKNVEDADIEGELTADLVGEYLFSDTDFINNLSTQNRNVFQKIYDEIKYLCKVVTAGSKEARELERVRKAFEDAYRADGKAQGETKYSLSDSDGRQLTKGQQEYFKDSKVRDENGNLKVMYHGTPNGNFTVFKDGTYFTDNKEYADRYQNPGASSISTGKVASNPKTFEVYLDIKKPFDINDAEARDIYINDYIKGGNAMGINPYLSDAEYGKINAIDWTEGEDLRDFLIENEYDYDGLVLDEGGTGGYGDEVQSRGKSYVVFSPEQVKNIDNLKPSGDPDIRFSLSKAVEETKDLMALHNLTEQKLLKSLKLGGLPMPSVAIAKAKDGHGEFGEISLILPKESIDPESSNRNKLYSGDAWTPTYPKVEYKLNSKVLKQVRDKINGLVPANIQEFGRLHLDSDNMEDTLNRYGGDMVDAFKDNDALKYAYLMEAEADIQLPMKEKNLSYSGARENGAIIKVAETIPAEDINKALNGGSEEIQKLEPAVRKAVAEYVRETYGDDQFILDTFAPEDGLSFSDLDGYLVEARKYLRTGVEQTVDTRPARELIRDMTVQYSYEEWLNNLFSGIVEKEGIRNDKDYFTPSGNRRSFEALHYEHNLENVIKAMREKGEKGIGFGGGSIFGAATTEFSSVDEMKQASGRLHQMSEEEHQEIKDGFTKRFFELASSLPNDKKSFMATDDAANTLTEAVAKYQTRRGIANYLRRELKGWATYSDQVVDDLIELVNDIRSMPTGYFEAKPQRAVSFEEVGVFVIPYDADVKLKQELLNRGYSIAEYDPKVEGDRQRVVNQFEEYKFSLSNVGEESVRPNYRVTMGEDIALQTEDIAPVGEVMTPTAEENSTVQQETQLTEDNSTLSETETGAPLPDSGEEVKQTRKQYHQSIIDRIRGTFKTKGFDFDNVLKNAKNLSTWSTVDNTPQRVMEKALGYKAGGVLADITVNKVAQNESEGIKWVNRNVATLKQISRQYHIKPGSKESAAAQMYAEGFYVNKNNEIVRYGDPELIQDFKNPEVRRNIKGLARDPRIRKIYDDTLASINESRTRNLYPEIPRLDNYFLHFRAMTDTFSTLGLPFNPNDIRAKDLPTDLNGVTADLKPGQPYFASAMHREGKRTSFDLLGGVERYLNSAKNQIYHIDDIQTLRALRNHIAETYGQATGLEDIDSLSDAEAEERIKQVYGAHLSTFAKFLNEEANVLAGKTALIDRGLEGIIGRRGITFLNTLNQQVGSNMVGYNVSSSLTNFLPVAQTFAKTNKFDFVKAFAQTAANKVSGGRLDSFAEDSPVVIRRKGQDRFYQTPWQKMQNPGYALMGMVDDISTELIARTKYNELTRKGMDSQKAHFETDKWVSRLMGDRSLGQMPQLYNSKMLGLITKFQLEVRNQLDAQFYDTVQETKVSNEHIRNGLARNARTAAQVASTFAQLAVVQHLFGMAFESVAGYNPAFDIIEVLMTAFGYDDEEDSEDTALDNFAQGLLALAEDMPYASTFTGGRIPISEAIPDVNAILRGEDEYGNEIGIPRAIVENAKEIAPYYLLPGGFGQAKKTVAGLKMFSDEHPIAGSYTDAGNLRFPVEDTVGNRIHAGIFGQYANENARKYFDQEQRTLNPDQTEILAGLDIPIEEYWEYRDNLYEFYDVKDQMKEAAYADGATSEDSLKYKYINSVYNEIYDLYDKQKELASGNSSNKQSKLRSIQNQMEQMLSESKSAMDNAFITSSYAEVGDRRYNYDADKDTWYEIKPKNADGTDNWYYQKEQEVTKGLGISYTEYWSNREEYNYAYDKPGRYAISQAVGGYDAYMEYYDALENWQSDNYIASDKDEYGNTISGSRKPKVWDYIDGLDLDYGEKLILYRTVYSSKKDKNAYNMEIVNYLNSRSDLSYGEKKSILEELEMTVDDEGYIDW